VSEISDVQKPLLTQWLKATFLGWLLAFVAIIVLALIGEGLGLGGSQFFVGVGAGLGIGYTQARLLQKRFGTGLSWMWGSAIGMGISFTFFDIGHRLSESLPEFNLYYSVILGGLLCGLLQFRTIRSVTDRSPWWIPLSLVAWSCVAGLVLLNDSMNNLLPHNIVTSLVGMMLLIFGPGLVLGVVSGVGMRWILKPITR
jgi:hypothetical protein